VPGVVPPGEVKPRVLKRSAVGRIPCCPPFNKFSELAGASDGEVVCPLIGVPVSLCGRGLFLGSFSEVVEAEGVTFGDWPASLEDADADGDEVPSFGSLFFLEDLFGSFERESWSC
jgi:hypothetical protein